MMSKELEALKELGNYLISDIDYCVKDTNEYDIIETALKELDFYKKRDKQWKQDVNKNINKLQAFEIIKEKEVNVLILKYSFMSSEGLNYYNKHFPNEELHLTQEEYDLLKEVLL